MQTTHSNDQHHDMQHTEHEQHAAHTDHTGHEQIFQRRFWVCLLLSVPVLVYSPAVQAWFGYSAPAFPGSQWITSFFAILVFLIGGVPFIQMAVPELRQRQPGMMTLISMAILVALGYSLATLSLIQDQDFFWELVTLIDIMLLGHWIEMRSVRQASSTLDELSQLIPDEAERYVRNAETETVPVSRLQKNDLVLVRPGASIPADGIVQQGESHVNESMITGESKPIHKQPGEQVIAGTINGDGSLRVRVEAIGDDTALTVIMRLVEDAQQSKSRTQLLADKAAGWLFYAALVVAMITAAAWTFTQGFNNEVIKRVATVLVIACPHALGLAIPLVIAITTSIAANNGILVRDRVELEKARQLDMVIFDKTGTLTEGDFGVVSLFTKEGVDENQALSTAAAVEGDSEHIIARGIRRAASDRGLDKKEALQFKAIKGRGVRASMNGKEYYVGSQYLLETLGLDLSESMKKFADQAGRKSQTVVYLADQTEVQAAFSLADQLRPESKPAVAKLHDMGIEVALLTGDSQATAESVAQALEIDQYFAEVLPEHKDQKIQQLQDHGKLIAMVGDGVNDAPALSRADVGIAIGSGTDVAVESAGVILVNSNPLDIIKVIELSSASYRKMAQNLFWAAGYNVLALPLAAGILVSYGIMISPAAGALLMSLSTVIVALNAQLLHKINL